MWELIAIIVTLAAALYLAYRLGVLAGRRHAEVLHRDDVLAGYVALQAFHSGNTVIMHVDDTGAVTVEERE